MFLLIASALGGATTALGWPCQRLNWGWRNVWSTCSIHSFVPAPAGTVEPPTGNVGYRYSTNTQPPFGSLNLAGWYQPTVGSGTGPQAIPQFFCQNAAATGTGATASLRNRCRRAVDAYGALVRSCTNSPQLGGNRGPVAGYGPDWAPAAGHTPHITNVAGLAHVSGFCNAPNPGVAATPSILSTPSNTCPGLLGWFTVVFNACGFTNVPALAPGPGVTQVPNAPVIHNYFPLGNTVSPNLMAGGVSAGAVGIFCTTGATSATSWNPSGAAFRTSRCRKALDQFGRTAQRCHNGFVAPGPAQSNGFADPLRLFAVGNVPAGSPLAPNALNVMAPLCN